MNPHTTTSAVSTAHTMLAGTAGQLPAVLQPQSLEALGLKAEDLPAVRDVAAKIDPRDVLSVSQFGREIAEHTSRYADELLGQLRNKDLDAAGAKLSEVVSIARSLNMNALTDRRSKIPLIGGLIDKMKLGAGNFMGQFESTKEQIERLVDEVDQTQQGLASRNVTLNEMFGAVKEEHRLLGVHIAAGVIRLEELRGQAEGLRQSGATSPTAVQDLADLDAVVANLDIRIGNLRAMQQSALQTLPQIRVIQTSNQVLVDKFHTIREVTVPAWKRQFMLALGLNEQRNAVELADKIDDTTNDLLRRNADLLKRNATQTAKANQRLVIDVTTLQHVQDSLIATVEDVIQIQRDGAMKRQAAERSIETMRRDLQAKLTAPGTKATAA